MVTPKFGKADNVWCFWDGPMPTWIGQCLATLKRHSNVTVLTREAFAELQVEDKDLDLSHLCLPHQADFIRLHLLKHYGGLWVDADCVVLKDLNQFMDTINRFGLVSYIEHGGQLGNNFLGAVSGHPVIEQAYGEAVKLISTGKQFGWCDIGGELLKKCLTKQTKIWHRIRTELIQPINWASPEEFLVKRTDEEHAKHFNTLAYTYMISHMRMNGVDNSHDDILDPTTFFSFLLRKAGLK